MLPNLIITGFPKCGTTSLFSWLADHPQVVGSSVKETNYFVDPGTHSFRPHANFRDHGLPGYEAYFPSQATEIIILEATPQYAYQKTALAELPTLPSTPKFLFVLRHPADQILSIYSYYKSNFNFIPEDMTFANFVKCIRNSGAGVGKNELLLNAYHNCNYERHLEMWLRVAGADRMLVYIFEQMKVDKRQFMRALANDLRIDPSFYENYGFRVENYTYKLRSYHLHQLNIRLRKALPISQRGLLWRGLRAVYRKLNTRPNDKALSARDQDAYDALKEEWTPGYSKLVRRYEVPTAATSIGTADVAAAN